ncbi:DUF1671-domain-containing protein [Diplogelasinospora grovesii]|uniref:DUF1671-domain-containing protein n=1 Tax=Diplogelasinospora grovesii TaxID=303347 RepID=A0AAN6NHX9_9PEZI|nr:DUF1671-domain-containing protein [Diplogelasinospora grovesii]
MAADLSPQRSTEATEVDAVVDAEIMTCPFCGWKAPADGEREYGMLLHMETLHAEGDSSPFVVAAAAEGNNDQPGNGKPSPDNSSSSSSSSTVKEVDGDVEYGECPVDGCEEILLLSAMDYHLELHAAQEEADAGAPANTTTSDNRRSSHSQKNRSSSEVSDGGPARPPATAKSSHHHRKVAPSSREPTVSRRDDEHRQRRTERRSDHDRHHARPVSIWKSLFGLSGTSSVSVSSSSKKPSSSSSSSASGKKQLGKAELGKWADEGRMPDWLFDRLQRRDPEHKSEGVIPVLAQLLEQSSSTRYAYLCNPCVQHVSKIKGEGGFCGFRNIQMMCSYIMGVQFQGYQHFSRKIPSVLQIQEYIETAWDQGINTAGREETGGVRGTRKYIGTSEASAVFRLLDIPCDFRAFKHPKKDKSEALLMVDVENYFQQGVDDPLQKVRRTNMPPLYFQHPNHSLTIIGFERQKDGSKNLIVFDPAFGDNFIVKGLIGKRFEHSLPDLALRPYRRGHRYLGRYNAFEVLKLTPPEEGFPAISQDAATATADENGQAQAAVDKQH